MISVTPSLTTNTITAVAKILTSNGSISVTESSDSVITSMEVSGSGIITRNSSSTVHVFVVEKTILHTSTKSNTTFGVYVTSNASSPMTGRHF